MNDDLRLRAALAALPELIRNEFMMARGEQRPISWPAVAEDCFLLADAFVLEAAGTPTARNVQDVATCIDGYVRHRWITSNGREICGRCAVERADIYARKQPQQIKIRRGHLARGTVLSMTESVG
jgi:hypothetical protein